MIRIYCNRFLLFQYGNVLIYYNSSVINKKGTDKKELWVQQIYFLFINSWCIVIIPLS